MIQKKNSGLIRKKRLRIEGNQKIINFRLTDALRNRLKAEMLDALMTTDIEGPPSKDFDVSTALHVWARTNRRIGTCTSASS